MHIVVAIFWLIITICVLVQCIRTDKPLGIEFWASLVICNLWIAAGSMK